jgi:hypothetical protein
MPKRVDRVGHRYGKLMVLSFAGRNALKKVLWNCVCNCGRNVVAVAGDLVTGNTQSCGCYFKEKVTKHGGSGKGSYNTWRAMMRRCYKPQDKDYKRYGATGISVCDRWHSYELFAEDMGEPAGAQTLDRVDPYGNYTPENCRWADLPTQARNVRVPKTSKTGVTGVLIQNKRYYAAITVQKKKFYSKCFTTLEEAAAARKELELKHWGAA